MYKKYDAKQFKILYYYILMNDYYDIIIVGAGLSGLYSAYNIKKTCPYIKLLVLESNRRPYIGGRIGNETFYGANIVIGAGVGRKDTDKLLIKLLKELDINYEQFKVDMNYSDELIKNSYIDIKQCLNKIKRNNRKTCIYYIYKMKAILYL